MSRQKSWALSLIASICVLAACDKAPDPASETTAAATAAAPTDAATAAQGAAVAQEEDDRPAHMRGMPRIPEIVLPTFEEPPAGERAPSAQAIGFTIGATTFAEFDERAKTLGLNCRDTSARAMFINIYKKYERGEGKAAHGAVLPGAAGAQGDAAAAAHPHAAMHGDKANPHAAHGDAAAHPHAGAHGATAHGAAGHPHGANPHAAHGKPAGVNPHAKEEDHGVEEPASPMKLSGHGNYIEMAKSPQIRYSCANAEATMFDDIKRGEVRGRLLAIFDSDAHPLRLLSFGRTHQDQAAALADAKATYAHMVKQWGEPMESSGELPTKAWAPFSIVKRTWKWADVTVTMRATSLGERGVQIEERVEVPQPIRADAPAKP